MQVVRRAPRLYRELSTRAEADPLSVLDWVNLYALAVNEENAAGGRVVTAPTNGAAGIIPAVLQYFMDFVSGADEDGVVEFLLTGPRAKKMKKALGTLVAALSGGNLHIFQGGNSVSRICCRHIHAFC